MTERRPAPPPLNLRPSASRGESSSSTSPTDVFRPRPPTPGTPAAGPSRSGSSTPFPASSLSNSPGSLFPSPQKRVRVQSLQAQMANDRSDVLDELRASESRITLRVDDIERLVQRATSSARDARSQRDTEFERFKLNIEGRLASLEADNAALRSRVAELEEAERARNTKVAKSSKAARAILGDKKYLAVQGVVHKSVAFLYNTNENPWPDWPREGDEWPRFDSEDGSEGDVCLRFDYSQAVDHPHNTSMLNYLVEYIDTHRSALPADLHESEHAKDVDKSVFLEAGKKYFQSLKKYRKKTGGAVIVEDSEEDQEGLNDSAHLDSDLGDTSMGGIPLHVSGALELSAVPATLASLEFGEQGQAGQVRPLNVSESESGAGSTKRPRTMPTLPDATRRRNRRLTSAAAVKLRRPLVLEFSAPQYEILEEIHSQMTEMDIEGRRVWLRESWMSNANAEAIKSILTAPLGHNKRYASSSRLSQEFCELVVEHPPWPTKTPERYLQRWQISSTYLAEHCVGLEKQIVPTDVPLGIAEVMRTGWFAKYHSGRMSAFSLPPETSALSRSPSLSSISPMITPSPLHKTLPPDSSRQLSIADEETNIAEDDGFDYGARGSEGRSRSRSRSASRSRSPVKQTPTQMPRILEETSSGILREEQEDGEGSVTLDVEDGPSF